MATFVWVGSMMLAGLYLRLFATNPTASLPAMRPPADESEWPRSCRAPLIGPLWPTERHQMDPPVPDESPGDLRFVINHVFLPPRLPQEDDTTADNDLALVASLYKSLLKFRELEPTASGALSPAIDMVGRFYRKEATTVATIQENICDLADGNHSIFYFPPQNAGMLATRKENGMLFEAFELLAPNRDVMSCEGSLLREFPTRAALVSGQVVAEENHEFKLNFAEVITTLEHDLAPNAHPKSKKAGSDHAEIRDTIAPVLVTGMLMDFLTGLGRCVEPQRYTKRSREQVNWSDSLLPFHRSPVWLLLRVSLRLALEHRATCDVWPSPKALYKAVLAFHHCRLLQQATASALGNEHGLLHCLNAKIAHRIIKLDPPGPPFQRPWLQEVAVAVEVAKTRLELQWGKVQANDNEPIDLGCLSSLAFRDDCNLRLGNLGPYLSWVNDRGFGQRGDIGPGDPTRFYPLPSMELPTSQCLASRSRGLQRFELLEFEAWVSHHLDSWRSSHGALLASQTMEIRQTLVEYLIKQLDDLINIYYCRAKAAYQDIPEALSVMFLTIMELWVTLDEIAGQGVELLRDYDPGLRCNLLNPLLLSTKQQMHRLHSVEQYLSSRKEKAGANYPSAFSNFGGSSSLAVRFFHGSTRHQTLLGNITREAGEKKEAKIREYEDMKSLYHTRVRERDGMGHNDSKDRHGDWAHKYWGCDRCRLDDKISRMNISIFEWPLPADTNHARAAVFEIDVNEIVKIWRGITMHLLTKIFREDASSLSTTSQLWWLATHSELHSSVTSKSRLHPASGNKRTNETHYNTMHIRDATAEKVCPKHGTRYSYYDEDLHVEPSTWASGTVVPSHCSYAQPGSFESWVRSSSHTSNEVIAAQGSCPESVSLEEFRTIGNLRSGDGLQWANILCQLVIPALDLNKDSSYDLIMQASLEAGVADDGGSVLRRAHFDAGCERYSKNAVKSLREAIQRVQESWQNETSLCILARLSARLFSVSSPTETSNGFLTRLDEIRRVSIDWTRELVGKLDESVSALDRDVFSRRILMSALICATTFDVDAQSLRSILGSASGADLNLAIYTEIATLVHDYLPGNEIPSERISRHLLDRWQRTKHASYSIIKEEILSRGNLGLDQTMNRLWGDFTSSQSGWLAEESPQGHVLVTDMEVEESDRQPIKVSFNILKGLVLVDGYPLARLPESYQVHPTFVQLFGQQILDVMPSAVRGMQFSARREQMGWIVHFNMINDRLVIRAVAKRPTTLDAQAPEVWEYIPREYVRGDLPSSFVEGCSHWVNLSTGEVQFREVGNPWVSTPNGWTLTQNAQSRVLSKDDCSVVDPHSDTAKEVLKIMGPLESKYQINCIFQRNRGTPFLAVELPRFRLSFSLFKGQSVLKSKDYPGMRVSEMQGIGTLIGLKNKLVLAPECPSSTQPRKVLIPESDFSSAIVGDHVEVAASPSRKHHIRHQVFEVHKILGVLSDNGSLRGKMLVCYLHALTSHCLPDPLTLRTGTEESLRLLSSAAIYSANQLDTRSAAYLQAIADISPLRSYYPDHLQVMETVRWSDSLPPLSQQDDFWQLAQDILEHFKGFGDIFTPSEVANLPQKLEHKSSEKLVKRARLRSSVFRVSEFGAEFGCETLNNHSQDVSKYDCWYHSTDLRHQKGPSQECNRVSLLVRCLDAGLLRSLYSPEGSLQSKIRAVTGDTFGGRTPASLGISLENLRLPAESIGEVWCNLHHILVDEPNKYRVMFFLSTLLYAQGAEWEIVQALMVLSMSQSAFPAPPAAEDFNLDIHRETFQRHAEREINHWIHRREICPAWSIPRNWGETNRQYAERRDSLRQSESARLTRQLAADLASQLQFSWSLATPAGNTYSSYIDISRAMQKVQKLAWKARDSHAFFDYLDNMARIISHADLMPDQARGNISESRILPTDKPRQTSRRFVDAGSLFLSSPAPRVDCPRLKQIPAPSPEREDESQKRKENGCSLYPLLVRLSKKALQSHQREYIQELRGSAESNILPCTTSSGRADPNTLLQVAHDLVNKIRTTIDTALSGGSIAHEICLSAGVYPRLSPVFILGRLTGRHWGKLSREWQICLVRYALSLIYLQRAERLSDPSRKSELLRELANLGSHDELDLLQRPESLLLELEQEILIRPVQQRIAETMRAPPSGASAVMQLNMGEGKSSVIVPLVVLDVADGTRLACAVVAKPQSKQMRHTLIAKLGGLVNRRVFYLPFSRSIRLSAAQMETVRQIIKTCREQGGVLLMQPEHLLSFKLMGIEKIWNEGSGSATASGDALKLYQEFEEVSRYIVDESDENFSVKFELIYTMGSQQPVEMSPGRWTLIEAVLELLRDIVKSMADSKLGGGGLEGLLFEERFDTPGGFPTIRVLEEAAGRRLMEKLARIVCKLGLPGFPIHNQTASMREAVLTYMVKEDLNQNEISKVEKAENGFFGENNTQQAVLLLRGLLAKGVLLFALGQKRYRVNYGLAPDRRPATMLAVPYRAKDMPSPRSEFSHPDVIIVLTCLSYYYRGLSFEELFVSLETLSRSDLASQEYSIWTSAATTISPTLRHFSGVNLKDEARCRNLVYPALRYVKPAIDFYLSNVVFAKEMKEFPSKLSASGWDLAKPKTHPLTGFSGTIDSKRVLPLTITALDLPDQRHTNAAVLDCLLREENKVLELGGQQSKLSALTIEMLLEAVTRNKMRVILDVGAQIIECSNAELAKRWLDSAPEIDTDAVIFFNDDDELSVLTRSGSADAFLTSPFASHTDRCLVFLDQAHTRGTDLRLPDLYRAAVTLGPAITKDTLVQACMRMRKLGRGQSVTFCVSPEMQRRIRTTCSVEPSQAIAVIDVLEWAISETWDEEVRSMPLWENQGVRHLYQETVWNHAAREGKFTQKDAEYYIEPEAQTLEHRYRPISAAAAAQFSGPPTLLDKLASSRDFSRTGKERLTLIQNKAEAFKTASATRSANLQEEQERELAPEIEQERQVERPTEKEPQTHKRHPDLETFVYTGRLKSGSNAFLPPFQALEKSSAVQYLPAGVSNFPCDLLITADYARTVHEGGQGYYSDMYQRPVQWVLTSKSHMVIISQWEANELKSILMKSSGAVVLRAYLPRPSLTYRTLEDLQLYTVPASASQEISPELVMQLNLFAGQLYLRSYRHYVALCRYLGLSYKKNEGNEMIAADGFVGKRDGENAACRFETSPVMFLSVLFKTIRRDCTGIEKTHMGKILAGEILTEKDFVEED
ncbi:hypothetical protein B0T18DRAFT_394422 [Schizothecium vesticola]|uniref:ubiquitinyl hydrolase 1 n=1 Tax=Schizothecium vesticola TaxID=314040 RepID=A0AA40EGV5_9PEZI|nr:hypothetical protein B0T18DRAFT_394422 [Schizothecium vesticola]